MVSTGLVGDVLEERLVDQPGLGWASLKCQAKGFGQCFQK